MSDDYKSSAPTAQLGGAKRKNGHKANCSCHICENMKNKDKRGGYQEDAEKEKLKLMGGPKKKNGHKPDCGCPICKNMKNSKKGKKGGEGEGEGEYKETEGEYDEMDKNDSNITGGKGGKKSNGHKGTCKCPICKNMKKKGGGKEPDIENQLGDIEEGIVKGEKTETMDVQTKETPATEEEYDELDAAEKGMAGPGAIGGGTRKRRRSNGHKPNCGCPICKNIKRKTRRHRKRSHRRR
jgi:hypothetical protein